MRKWRMIQLALVLWLLSGCMVGSSSDAVVTTQDGAVVAIEDDVPVAAETAEATPEAVAPIGKTVVTDGELASPYPQLALGFGGEVTGDVREIRVKPGDAVKAGAVLAQLDDTQLRRNVEEARNTLERAEQDHERAQKQWERDVSDAEQALTAARRAYNSAQLQASDTNLEEARVALERAKKAETDAQHSFETPVFGDWTPPEEKQQRHDAWQQAIQEREMAEKRYQDALDSRSVNQLDVQGRASDIEKEQRRLDGLKAGMDPATARAVEDAQIKLKKAEDALNHATLVAPWDALVVSVDVAPQATVDGAKPIVTLLSVQDGLRFVTQNLSEQHIASLRVGQRAVVTLRTYPETPLEGVVESVAPQTGTETKSANDTRFTVRVKLNSTELMVLPGLTGRVEIFTDTE